MTNSNYKFNKNFKHKHKIYQKSVKGKWRNIKYGIALFILAVFYLTPLIRFSREKFDINQFLLIDFSTPMAYLGPLVFYQDEIYFFTIIIIIAIFLLIFFSHAIGRFWCGFICPQTVWSDFFSTIEKIFLGDSAQRIRLENSTNIFYKIYKYTPLQIVYILISIYTGVAWTSYFTDSIILHKNIINLNASNIQIYSIFVFAIITYVLGVIAKTKFCRIGCPWSKFQILAFDNNTFNVNYDHVRGEPRINKNNKQSSGDCIDCEECVKVCPAGIDIREGMQMECIGCALCIDACDDIMKKTNKPTGLIQYNSVNNMFNSFEKLKGPFSIYKILTLICFTIIITILFTVLLINKNSIEIFIEKVKVPQYVMLKNGDIRNTYIVKISNKSTVDKKLSLTISNLEKYKLRIVNTPKTSNILYIDAPANSQIVHKFNVISSMRYPTGKKIFNFNFTNEYNPNEYVVTQSTFNTK